MDYELKRDYQRFLQERNRATRGQLWPAGSIGEEMRAWAEAHGLPIVHERVQFPDVRIEYEHADGRLDREDLELATGHYNSRQMAAKRASGFRCIAAAPASFVAREPAAADRRSTPIRLNRCCDDLRRAHRRRRRPRLHAAAGGLPDDRHAARGRLRAAPGTCAFAQHRASGRTPAISSQT